jgi:hypothetical protein
MIAKELGISEFDVQYMYLIKNRNINIDRKCSGRA